MKVNSVVLKVKDMVRAAVAQTGADGLCLNDCGCGPPDLFACGDGPSGDCVLAQKLVVPADGEWVDPQTGEVVHPDGVPGDVVYVPLRIATAKESPPAPGGGQ